MQRLSAGSRWAVIIGLYLGARLASHLKNGLGFALLAIYFLFVLWVWVARPFGNLLLLFDRFARHALRRNEKIEAGVVGGSLCVGILTLTAGLGFKADLAQTIGIGLIAQSFPFAMTFTNPSRIGTWLFGAVGGVMVFATLFCVASEFLRFIPEDLAVNIFLAGCIGCLSSTWLGNIPALRKAP